jgi:acyl-CoA synthetase (AMP-forming)/AMP-acid ligase II
VLILSGYGPSETTNICTVRPSVSPLDLINNIGRPFDNTSAFVLDPHGDTILPRGAVGELCFGGYQVFREYLNRPDLTAAKVINHPRYGRIYRSGDLGVLLHDDSILSTGRLDDQVKIRGQRVELGEISSAILDQQCVRDCATVLLRDSRDSELLVTFWVPVRSDDTEFRVLEAQNLRSDILSIFAALSQRLPSYMIPSHLLPISRLPMTAQGKIDRRKLQRCFVDLTAEVKERVAASYDDPNGADPPATL